MQTLYIFDSANGVCLYGPDQRVKSITLEKRLSLVYPDGSIWWTDEPITNPIATFTNGKIDSVHSAPPPPTLYVHVTITGGTQSPAGTLYLKNDGVDALQVHAELRDGPELAASNAVTQLDGQDINGMWALELVNVDTGALADTPIVQMNAGAINVSYTTTIAPCEVELAEDRMQPIGDYQLNLAQPVRFKIVRELN